MFAISSENIEKVYDSELVLKNINLKVKEQEFLTILGPSGCGKSTLLHIFAGLNQPSSGRAYCQGDKITGPAHNRVMMMQQAALFPWLNIEKNVAFGLKTRNIKKKERLNLARSELERVGLGDVFQAYPHQLSGGMQQRAALARSLVLKPDILLMDEPFSALDEQTRFKLQQDLVELWQEIGMTVIFVTHSIREALLTSQRIIVMSSNPGQFKTEYKLNNPYPRRVGQPEIVKLEEKILADLINREQPAGSPSNNSGKLEKVAG